MSQVPSLLQEIESLGGNQSDLDIIDTSSESAYEIEDSISIDPVIFIINL